MTTYDIIIILLLERGDWLTREPRNLAFIPYLLVRGPVTRIARRCLRLEPPGLLDYFVPRSLATSAMQLIAMAVQPV